MSTPPLSPATGGLCLPTSSLQPADIIVSASRSGTSSAIRAVTMSAFSHAMLYAGTGFVIEAVPEGGVRRIGVAAALSHASLAVAYRRVGLSPAGAAKVISIAKANVGRKYDFSGAIGGGASESLVFCYVLLGPVSLVAASGVLQDCDRFYCSELVLDAFRRAGHPLSKENPSRSTPQSIPRAYVHKTLGYVGHLAG